MATGKEQLANYITKMGPDLGDLFYHLWLECGWLHTQWAEYVFLFGSKPEHFEVMNSTASDFLSLVQNAMWESVLLHVSRLTDPARIGKRENLTLMRLTYFQEQMPQVRLDLLIDQVKSKSSFARDWRNRLLARRDLGLAMGTSLVQLESASRDQVTDVLNALSEALNAVEGKFTFSTTLYSMSRVTLGAPSLIELLKLGIKAEKAREKKLDTGVYDPDDWE